MQQRYNVEDNNLERLERREYLFNFSAEGVTAMNKRTQEHNMLQVKKMRLVIDEFRESKVSLRQLIRDIGSLVDSLKETSEVVADDFIAWWAQLETVYAGALADQKEFLDAHDTSLIDEALESIEFLIEQYEEAFLSEVAGVEENFLVS
jgi:hypothetical protein